jgi:hypothetical protein
VWRLVPLKRLVVQTVAAGTYSGRAPVRERDYLTQKRPEEPGSAAPMIQIVNDDWTIGVAAATVWALAICFHQIEVSHGRLQSSS